MEDPNYKKITEVYDFPFPDRSKKRDCYTYVRAAIILYDLHASLGRTLEGDLRYMR